MSDLKTCEYNKPHLARCNLLTEPGTGEFITDLSTLKVLIAKKYNKFEPRDCSDKPYYSIIHNKIIVPLSAKDTETDIIQLQLYTDKSLVSIEPIYTWAESTAYFSDDKGDV